MKRDWTRVLLVAGLAFGVMAGVSAGPGSDSQWFAGSRVLAAAKHGKKRLILNDGSYLDVVQYKVRDGEVLYQRRKGGGWQEIPKAQVDWRDTKRWRRKHPHGVTGGASAFENISPQEAQREIEELDREEHAQRAAVQDMMPVVAPGLRLPDEDGIFALDHYKGKPEVLHLRQANGDLNENPFHSVQAVNVYRMHGFAELVRLSGVKAAVQLHVGKPVFYVRVHGAELPAPDNAFVVDVHERSRHGKHAGGGSAKSRFVIVKAVRQGESRVIYAVQVRKGGEPDSSTRKVQTQKTPMADGHWLKVVPVHALEPGEYALVEMLGGPEVNQDVWAFGVSPNAPENVDARLPVSMGR